MEIERKSVTEDPTTGTTEAVHTKETVLSDEAVAQKQGNKANAYVWYVVGVINVLLALRFVFLLMGAKNTGFTSVLYQISYPFMAMFKGIFGNPGVETGYFDTASILAMVIIGLLGWGIVALIDIGKGNKTN